MDTDTASKKLGIDKYGWYDVNAYANTGGYMIGNDYETLKFPTTYNA